LGIVGDTDDSQPIVTIFKKVDQIVNDSDVPVNDNDFKLEGEKDTMYALMVFPIVNSSVNADYKHLFAVPMNATVVSPLDGGWRGNSPVANEDFTIADNASMFAVDDALMIFCYVIMGDTKGTIQYKWSQNFQEISNTIVRKSSFMIGWKQKL